MSGFGCRVESSSYLSVQCSRFVEPPLRVLLAIDRAGPRDGACEPSHEPAVDDAAADICSMRSYL